MGRRFKHVSGSWIAPAVTCTPGSTTYSAFWVGIGGLSQHATGLEQTGTEADCDSNGVAHYSAWYELVPAGPVTLNLAVAAGDSISAGVTVDGTKVTIHLLDNTSGASVVKHLRLAHPDTTSAEWIAEAPSTCDESGSCTALPLTDFGTVAFSKARARTAHGIAGTISELEVGRTADRSRRALATGHRRQIPGPSDAGHSRAHDPRGRRLLLRRQLGRNLTDLRSGRRPARPPLPRLRHLTGRRFTRRAPHSSIVGVAPSAPGPLPYAAFGPAAVPRRAAS